MIETIKARDLRVGDAILDGVRIWTVTKLEQLGRKDTLRITAISGPAERYFVSLNDTPYRVHRQIGLLQVKQEIVAAMGDFVPV